MMKPRNYLHGSDKAFADILHSRTHLVWIFTFASWCYPDFDNESTNSKTPIIVNAVENDTGVEFLLEPADLSGKILGAISNKVVKDQTFTLWRHSNVRSTF
jgi:hypothetical protein